MVFMETTVLGSTGRVVSRIGFGGATAGIKNYIDPFDPANRADRDRILGAIRRAYELGVTYYDTAAAYGAGASEELFGEGLEGIPEGEIFLATKMGVCSYSDALRSLEMSLRRLRRDRVDLIQLHGTVYTLEQARQADAPGGMLDALDRAKDEGLVGHIGFTVECQNEALYYFLRTGRLETIQVEYNLLYQHPYDPNWKCGSLFDAKQRSMGTITMRTLTSGVFQRWMRHIRPDDDYDYSGALLQFVLSSPLVDVALCGMRDAAEVEKNVCVCNDLTGRIDPKDIHGWYR